MLKVLFFLMGMPMMILSFFEAVDVIPYISTVEIYANGSQIEISNKEQLSLQKEIEELFRESLTMPAFGVAFDEMFKEDMKDGIFVSMKFDKIFQINELPFDELIFKVGENCQCLDLIRGIDGKYNGRCVHIDLNGKNMNKFLEHLKSLEGLKDFK